MNTNQTIAFYAYLAIANVWFANHSLAGGAAFLTLAAYAYFKRS